MSIQLVLNNERSAKEPPKYGYHVIIRVFSHAFQESSIHRGFYNHDSKRWVLADNPHHFFAYPNEVVGWCEESDLLQKRPE